MVGRCLAALPVHFREHFPNPSLKPRLINPSLLSAARPLRNAGRGWAGPAGSAHPPCRGADSSAGGDGFSCRGPAFSCRRSRFSSGGSRFSAGGARFSSGGSRFPAGGSRFSCGGSRFSCAGEAFSGGKAGVSSGGAGFSGGGRPSGGLKMAPQLWSQAFTRIRVSGRQRARASAFTCLPCHQPFSMM